MKLTEQDIKELCPRVKDVKQFTEALNTTFQKYSINTPLRIAAFLARMAIESWYFTKFEEVWTNSPQQQKYDPASGSSLSKILGNTKIGDGKRFSGKSIIQLTGRSNYEQYSKFTGIDFVNAPDKLKEYPWKVDCGGWFWNSRNLNLLADKGDIVGIVKKIQGGTGGLEETKREYIKYLKWFKSKGYS